MGQEALRLTTTSTGVGVIFDLPLVGWCVDRAVSRLCESSCDLLINWAIRRYKGQAFSDRTHYFVTSLSFRNFLRVSHFGVCEGFMPAPCMYRTVR